MYDISHPFAENTPILVGQHGDEYSREFKSVLKDIEKILQEKTKINSDDIISSFDKYQHEEFDNTADEIDEEGNFSDDYLLQNEKRPFVLGIGKYNFGKRVPYDTFTAVDNMPFHILHSKSNKHSLNNEKRPFVSRDKRPFALSGSNFGKREYDGMDGKSESKRPFVGSGYRDYAFGKRNDGEMSSRLKRLRYQEINDMEKIMDSSSSHISKRPFIMGVGGFRSNGKRPSVLGRSRYHRPHYMGSGFRFGKRNQDNVDQSEFRDNELLKKRRFSPSGNFRPKDKDDIFKGWSNYPMIIRYNKRRLEGEFGDIEENLYDAKRPFVLGVGKRFNEATKRSFTFRNDYLFDRLRHKSNSVTKDRSRDKIIQDNIDALEVPFRYAKRPFTTGGGFRSRVEKRPFVLSGHSHGYVFGK